MSKMWEGLIRRMFHLPGDHLTHAATFSSTISVSVREHRPKRDEKDWKKVGKLLVRVAFVPAAKQPNPREMSQHLEESLAWTC